ncbi:hypothetical protein [Comamonas testosteroni]|uniref:hypothetical protein n=1 Tax=Comamonas testosteroni TaxID=285 RepID=UPI0012D2CA56|nr:hypothetical protein [Comamonas testosteroni]
MKFRFAVTIQHAVEHYFELLQEGSSTHSALAEVSRIYDFAQCDIQTAIDAMTTTA